MVQTARSAQLRALVRCAPVIRGLPGTLGTGTATVFPHATQAAVAQKVVNSVPARAPWADGSPSYATQAAKPESGDSEAAGSNGSSSSSPVGGHLPLKDWLHIVPYAYLAPLNTSYVVDLKLGLELLDIRRL